MKRTASPPNIADLLRDSSASIERLIEASNDSRPSSKASYVHWDTLTDSSLPSVLSLREWWLALKLRRLLSRHPTGLTDQRLIPFTLGDERFCVEALHELDRSQAPHSSLDEPPADKNLNASLAVTALREEAIASAQLDRADVDSANAHNLLRLQRKPRDHGERMVLNVHRALEQVREIHAQPLTLGTLAGLHQRLTVGTLARPDLSGRLRRLDDPLRGDSLETQLIREPPPAVELPSRLKTMLAFANGRAPAGFIHPILRAMTLHFWVVYDMPFADGNGRLARALFYWSVLHAGYDIFDLLAPSAALRDSPSAYLRAFHYVETDDNDLMYFAAHLFDAITRARKVFRDAAKLEELRMREAQELTATQPELNARQRAIIAAALKDPRQRWLLQEHARNHRLARQTARNDFTPLVRRGWFEETKVGKALAFFSAPALAEKVKS